MFSCTKHVCPPRSHVPAMSGEKSQPKSSQCLEPCATIRDTQRETWQMAILMFLFDFNEFIRYLALMETAVEGLAQSHNKWKALISVEWVEKKGHSSLLASSCALLWVAVTGTVDPGVLVPLAGQPKASLSEWSAGRRWRSVCPLHSSRLWMPQCCLTSE